MTVEYRDPESCKQAGITYHMAIESEWTAQKNQDTYLPSVFDADGFIHCTNGLDRMEWVGNAFYTGSPDARTVLVVEVARVTSELRYDDTDQTFPHIYGPLNTSAVVAELPVLRGEDGRFVRIGTV